MTYRSAGQDDLQAEPSYFIAHGDHLREQDAEGSIGECLRQLGDEELDVELPAHLRVSVFAIPVLREIEMKRTLKPKLTSASPIHPHTGMTTTIAYPTTNQVSSEILRCGRMAQKRILQPMMHKTCANE